MIRTTMFFGLGMIASVALAAPDIHIGAMHDYLASDKTTLVKRVRNNGDSTAFVRVNVIELLRTESGKLQEQAVTSIDPTAPQQEVTLIASPARLIVAANGMQATRLMHTGPRDIERYYRLRFVPVAPEEKTGFSAADTARYWLPARTLCAVLGGSEALEECAAVRVWLPVSLRAGMAAWPQPRAATVGPARTAASG